MVGCWDRFILMGYLFIYTYWSWFTFIYKYLYLKYWHSVIYFGSVNWFCRVCFALGADVILRGTHTHTHPVDTHMILKLTPYHSCLHLPPPYIPQLPWTPPTPLCTVMFHPAIIHGTVSNGKWRILDASIEGQLHRVYCNRHLAAGMLIIIISLKIISRAMVKQNQSFSNTENEIE